MVFSPHRLFTTLFVVLPFMCFSQNPKWLVDHEYVIYSHDKPLTVHLPTVTLTNKKAEAKINARLSADSVLNWTMAELQQKDNWDGIGFEEVSYTTGFCKGPLIQFEFSLSYSAAYPTDWTINLVFDTISGKRISLLELVDTGMVNKLVKRCDDTIQYRIMQALAGVNQDPEDSALVADQLTGKSFSGNNLKDITLSAEGVTINYSFDFPHCCSNAEPPGAISFTHQQLKLYYRPKYLKLFAP